MGTKKKIIEGDLAFLTFLRVTLEKGLVADALLAIERRKALCHHALKAPFLHATAGRDTDGADASRGH